MTLLHAQQVVIDIISRWAMVYAALAIDIVRCHLRITFCSSQWYIYVYIRNDIPCSHPFVSTGACQDRSF